MRNAKIVCIKVLPNMGYDFLNICLKYVMDLSMWFLTAGIEESSKYVTRFAKFIRLKKSFPQRNTTFNENEMRGRFPPMVPIKKAL